MENSETQGWLEFAKECKYMSLETFEKLNALSTEVGRLVNYMMENTDKFGL